MSVDERLQELFAAPTPQTPVEAALDRVHRRAARERTQRRVLAGAAAGIVLAAGLSLSLASRDPQPEPAPAPPGPSQVEDVSTPVDGTWEAGPVRAVDIRATLRAAGEQQWAATVLADFPEGPITYHLEVVDGVATTRLEGKGARARGYDEERVTVTGEELMMEPAGVPGVNRYTWSLSGDVLRLRFVSTSEGGNWESPSAAFQLALYTVADWNRVP